MWLNCVTNRSKIGRSASDAAGRQRRRRPPIFFRSLHSVGSTECSDRQAGVSRAPCGAQEHRVAHAPTRKLAPTQEFFGFGFGFGWLFFCLFSFSLFLFSFSLLLSRRAHLHRPRRRRSHHRRPDQRLARMIATNVVREAEWLGQERGGTALLGRSKGP